MTKDNKQQKLSDSTEPLLHIADVIGCNEIARVKGLMAGKADNQLF